MVVLMFVMACGSEGGDTTAAEPTEPTESTETAQNTETPEVPSNNDTSLPGDADAGQTVYQSFCVACHAADGTGNGGMTGGNFVGEPERLQQDNAVLLAAITDGVLDASPPMPAWGASLDEQQIKDVLSYIRREFGQ